MFSRNLFMIFGIFKKELAFIFKVSRNFRSKLYNVVWNLNIWTVICTTLYLLHVCLEWHRKKCFYQSTLLAISLIYFHFDVLFRIRSSHVMLFFKISLKKVLLKISQNSYENTCAKVSLLIKLQAERPVILLKKRLWHTCFPGILRIFYEQLFYKTSPVVASVHYH